MSNPQATVLGYCAEMRTQSRLAGAVTLSPSGTDRADNAWSALPPWTRGTYAGGTPGDERAFDTPAENVVPAGEGDGHNVFGVVTFRATSLDWFQLHRQDNRRAKFNYGETGSLVSSQWINP